MKVAYVDSSCIVALVFNERHASTLRTRMRRFDLLVSSSLLEAEVACALKREERPITDVQWSGVRLIHPDRSLTSEISRVLGAGYLR
ncbi:MAG: PIN domain-containing protein, partial [Gemmatimonadaceae bacterium]